MTIDELLTDLPVDAEAFRNRYPHEFLVKRPATVFRKDTSGVEDEIEYRTVTVSHDDDGIPPWEWFIAPLVKRVGNPFPDHLSVGRAPNCDIVMRFRYVSKLHARLHLKDRRVVAVEDHGSSNGTGINGRQLVKGRPVGIRGGDKLSFGSLVVTMVTPEELYSLIRHRRGISEAPGRSVSG